MSNNITGWIKKDSDNIITISWSESVTNTVSYSATSSNSVKVGASLMSAAIDATNYLSKTNTYTWSGTQVKTFTYTIDPTKIGNYFCIAVNYQTRKYLVDHYHQQFRWFSQGDYIYKYTSDIRIPIGQYLAKKFKFELDGNVYEK